MKNSILITIAILSVITTFGQKIATKVPTEAQYVLTINTPNMLTKMSVKEMSELPVVNKAVNSFVKGRKYYDAFSDADKSLGINDLGFDYTTPAYFFVQSTDSITYFGYLIQLNDVSKFEALNDTSMKMLKNTKNLKVIGSNNQIIAWNKTTALFLSSSKDYTYFEKRPKIYANYGITIDTNNYSYNYYNFYNEQDEIAKIWMQQKASAVFAKKSNKKAPAEFLSYADNNAALTMWSSPQSLYTQYMGVLGGLADPAANFPGGDVVYHAYLNEKDVTLKSTIKLDDKARKSYNNMLGNQLNPKFFNYIDADKNLSYYSYAYSVKGLLEEMPNLINNYLGSSFNEWGIQESVDLLSVVIDEEAIGKVVCGDGILVLTDIGSKEMTYTEYEWDENYINKTEVTKTKDEIVPEFLYMLSTKDEESVEKIFKLSMKGNKKLIKEKGFYSLELYKNAPFKMYFVVKDGIVFMCNSEKQLETILSNKKVKALSEEQIKTISTVPLSVYLDGKQIMDKIPEFKTDSERRSKNKKMLDYAKENIGSLAVQQKIQGEGLVLEAKYAFTKDAVNSLKYFMYFFNDIYLIDKGEK
jgi:hypothetical protein